MAQGLEGTRFSKEESIKLKPGDKVKILGTERESWSDDAAFMLGQIVTLRTTDGNGSWRIEESKTWSSGSYRELYLQYNWIGPVSEVEKMVKQKDVASATLIQQFVDTLSAVLLEAGVPQERIPTPTYFINKTLNDWLDKSKVEEWLGRYIKEEKPSAPLDLSKFGKSSKKREIATPAE